MFHRLLWQFNDECTQEDSSNQSSLSILASIQYNSLSFPTIQISFWECWKGWERPASGTVWLHQQNPLLSFCISKTLFFNKNIQWLQFENFKSICFQENSFRELTLVISKEEIEYQACCGVPGIHQMSEKWRWVHFALLSELWQHRSVRKEQVLFSNLK